MKTTIATGVCAAVLALSPIAAGASDRDALEIEGSYILFQEDGHQRVLSFDRSGNVFQASDLQTVIGFTVNIGAWEATGPDSAKARVAGFNFSVDSGQRAGSAIVGYDFAFDDLVQGKYQTVTGSISGRQYGVGQDPLAPTEEPVRAFDYTFKGKRITVE